MTNKHLSLVLLALLPSFAAADVAADKYFAGQKDPTLTQQEREAMKMADKFRGENGMQPGARPSPGKNGAVTFQIGTQQPSVVCAPFQLCDISMQPGEQILDVKLGDAVRWKVEPARSGSGLNEVQHVIITPTDVGLTTNMIVLTDQRSYSIQLRSHRTKYMPQVNFGTPAEDQGARFRALAARETARRKRDAMTTPTGEYLGDLSFGYRIDGNARWKPTRVYNDGKKTIIEMPDTLSQDHAPALLVLRESHFFKSDDTTLVNYRVQNNKYIVDGVPDSILLLSGVGSRQERVTITRAKNGRG